jgi:Fe-S cluster assembly protein SufD
VPIDPADELDESIRQDETDVEELARRTGWKPSNFAKIKQHLFVREHWLDQYEPLGVPAIRARFDSDEAIAKAGLRLRDGAFSPFDLQLLRHEAAEAWYMRRHGPSYRRAHAAAQGRFPAPSSLWSCHDLFRLRAPLRDGSSMTTVTNLTPTTTGFTEDAFHRFMKGRDEPSWLIERRREAFARFRAFPWPSARDEEWRRTDIRALKLDAFAPPAEEEPGQEARASFDELWETMSSHYATGIEHINGIVAREPDPARLGKAVFLDLDRAVQDHPDLLQRYLLTQAVTPADDIFAALHAAFWTSGSLLYVPRGVTIEAPLFSLIGLAQGGSVDLSHTLVVLEDGAEATLVRETAGRGGGRAPALHAGALEVFLAPGARLGLVNIQNWDEATWHLSRERALVGRDASLQWTVGGLGSRLAKVNQEVVLAGPGANAQVNGILFTTGRQHLAYFTRQDHVSDHTTSDLLYRGGLKDKSRVVWKGMIRVEKDAQRTDAYQKNDNLVLSDSARADSIPGLEIEANDVRCTHGATAGRVDEDMIFYAEARGIPKETAVRLIVEGFFADVYDRITLEPVRETLRQAVATKLA